MTAAELGDRQAVANRLAPLAPFVGGRIQKASLTEDARIVLELFGGTKAWLVLAPTHPTHPIALVTEKPARDETPPGAQRLVRDALSGEKLISVDEPHPSVVALCVQTRDERPRTVFIELTSDPRLVLTAAKSKDAPEKVLVVVGGDVKTKDGRDVRRGRVYTFPKSDAPAAAPLEIGGVASAPQQVQKRDHSLSTLRSQLKARHRRYSRLVKALRGDLKRHGDPAQLRAFGDSLKLLLATDQPLPPKGADHVVVEGLDLGGEDDDTAGASDSNVRGARVPLDVTLDIKGNMEAFFRRARRAKEGHRNVAPRLDAAQGTLDEIERVRAGLSVADPSPEVREEANAFVVTTSEKGARRKAAATESRRAFRAFLAHGDVVIRVGRSAKDNDALTFHLAAGNDVWMHAREVAGSHVIFAAPPDVPQELLIDAAHLAAWFSPLQRADRIDVQWTRRKYIRKPGRGAPAGFVHVTKEKVLHLVVDTERTKRLLAREVEGATRAPKRGGTKKRASKK